MTYEMKNIKKLSTHNGVALTGTLYRDGKRIATVEDQGNGGSLWISWIESEKTEYPILREWFFNNCAGHWTERHKNDENCEEMAVELIIEISENNKDSKKSIVVRVVGDEIYPGLPNVEQYKLKNATIADTNALYSIVNQLPTAEVWDSSIQKYVRADALLMKVGA